MKRTRIFLIVIVLGLIAYIVFQAMEQSSQQSWKQRYFRSETEPYGTYILYERLEDMYKLSSLSLTPVSDPLTDLLAEDMIDTTVVWTSPTLWISLSRNLDLNEKDAEILLGFVEQGNHVLALSPAISEELLAALDLIAPELHYLNKDSLNCHYRTESWPLQPESETYCLRTPHIPFGKVWTPDSLGQSQALLTHSFGGTSLLRIDIGKGSMILGTQPSLLSNYVLLQEQGLDLAESILSQFPEQSWVLWDEYYSHLSETRSRDNPGLGLAGLRYILSQPALAWAFWVGVACMLLYVLTESKRKQRMIPVIKPLPNATLEFMGTLGGLYERQPHHRNMARKRVRFWWDFLKRQYQLPNQKLNDEFIHLLSKKSGVAQAQLKTLCTWVAKVDNAMNFEEKELLTLTEHLEGFYQKVQH